MQVIVNISLKYGVLDPQGRAIGRSLTDLGFQEVGDVRVGKRITLEIDELNATRARQRVARMCETLLANTVIEDYEIEIDEGMTNELECPSRHGRRFPGVELRPRHDGRHREAGRTAAGTGLAQGKQP